MKQPYSTYENCRKVSKRGNICIIGIPETEEKDNVAKET
jgi:hypothetical protein